MSRGLPVAESPNAVTVLRRVLLGGLILLGAWLLMRLVLAMIAPDSLQTPLDPVAAAPVSASSEKTYNFSGNPFAGGEAEIEAASEDLGEDAPETTLNLVLKGFRVSDRGSAIIRTPDGEEQNYVLGDEIMPDVFLRSAQPGFVVIDVNGQTQRLTFEKRNRPTQNSRNGEASLSTLRQADIGTLLSQVAVMPNTDGPGVRVVPVSAAIDLADYGLQKGDIITAIGSVRLDQGLPDIARLRRELANQSKVSVSLLRNGAPMTVTIG